jgi:hypothetical protein
VEAMPELRTDLTFLATIPAAERNLEVRGIVRGFINIKAMLDYLESSGVPTSAHDVSDAFDASLSPLSCTAVGIHG